MFSNTHLFLFQRFKLNDDRAGQNNIGNLTAVNDLSECVIMNDIFCSLDKVYVVFRAKVL